jgi:hypothetical protein
MRALWIALAVLGAIAFVWAVSADPQAAWSLYLVNLVFWAGIAATGPAISAMMQLTEARWSPSVRRLALTTAGFLPVAFVLLIVLFLGRAELYSWVTKPVTVKAAWLNVPFFFLRTLVLAAALFLTVYAFIRRMLLDPIPQEEDRERARRNRLATILLFLWLITLSLWGYDLLMSLDPVWYSGLFGGYFVVSALYTAFATLSILSVQTNARGAASIPAAAIQDVAKLQFAMSVMWMYFFWSQYLVIWYGNAVLRQPLLRAAVADGRLGGLRARLAAALRVPAQASHRAPARTAHAARGGGHLRPGRHLPRARAGGLPVGVGDRAHAARAARPPHHRRILRAVRAEPPVVHGALQARAQPAAHRRPLTPRPRGAVRPAPRRSRLRACRAGRNRMSACFP